MEEKAKDILRKYNQTHIIEWMDKQEEGIKQKIAKQVLAIDLEELEDLYKKVKKGITKKNYKITPINAIIKDNLKEEEKKEYIDLGESVLKRNKYAVVTMAGGQGTRLRT